MRLAHLLRDANHAIEEGNEGFALGSRVLLWRGVAIGTRREILKDSPSCALVDLILGVEQLSLSGLLLRPRPLTGSSRFGAERLRLSLRLRP